MSVNVNALFQHLMEDPDIVPPEGEKKKDIAMAMAIQRAKQSNNNTKALSMAKEYSNVEKLLSFLKAEEDDDAESASRAEELKPEDDDDKDPIDPKLYGEHLKTFEDFQDRMVDAGGADKYEWPERTEGRGLTAKARKEKQAWDAAVDYLTIHHPTMIDAHEQDVAMATAGGQEAAEESEEPIEDVEPSGRVSEQGSMESDLDYKNRIATQKKQASMTPEQRKADLERKLVEAQAAQDAEERTPHHTLTSAVDALSDAALDVELDYYGNDPDSPFHRSRFGTDPKAYTDIHENYSRDDLAQAYDQLEKEGKQRAINFDGKEGGSLVGSAVHDMMKNFLAQGRQKPPSASATREMSSEEKEAARLKLNTPAYNWFEANMPGKGAAARDWDQYVSDNFGDDLSKVLEMDIGTRTIVPLDEHKINEHLHNFLKGRGKKNLTTPPKPTPTAGHVEPEVQKEIVIASQDADDPKQAIEAKLAEHTRSVIDNPVLTPGQQKLMIDSAKALAEVAAKKVSTPKKEITIEPPDDVTTSETILENAVDIHIKAEANGKSDDEKSKAAENVHDAVISHETAGGNAESILQAKGTRYRKLDSGQYHFQGGGKVWGDLAHRDAIGQTPEGGDAPSTDTPEAQDERQAAFDFDAPPSAVKSPAEEPPEVKVEPEDTPKEKTSLKERIADATRKAGEDVERLKTELATATENEEAARAAVKAEEDTPTETEEVKPTEETPDETPTPEPEPEPTEGEAEQEVQVTPPDAEAGEAVAEPVVEPAPGVKPARKSRQRKPKEAPEAPVEEAAPAAEPEVAVIPPDDGTPPTPPPTPDAEDAGEDELPEIDKQKQFLIANKMTPDHLKSLSDEDIDKEFKSAHKKISDKAMANNLNGVPDKEEVIQDMAEAHGKGSDEKYKEQLRQDHKYTSVQDLIKEHKAIEKEKAANKFEHQRNDAISSALNMDELPEEGLDKLHAMDRLRDIAKKLSDNTMAVDKGGKPLLDSNAQSHLKDLFDDAMDKGDLTQEEMVGIAREALEKGEDFLNEDHKASIAADNARQRAHHEDFLGHAEDMSEAALQRRGHDLDHSKAHELHDYDTNEDGTIGERTGSSHHYREEDGSVGHKEGAGSPDSANDAVRGKDGEPMEANHPPKLLGLSEDGKAEQKEHFDLMKRGAAVPLSDEEMARFKELEGKNPDLTSPQYKGQLLGAQRHQLSGEGGAEKMSAMGIDEKDHDEAAGNSCRPPVGAMPPGGDKGWNPDSHRWADKEYLKEIQGGISPGGASYHPDGLHAGAVDKDGNSLAHLDQDAAGNVQAVMVTPTGVHKVNPPTGGSKGMQSADGGAISSANVLGHHLKDHPGGSVDKDTLHAMGMNHSEIHTGEGQKSALGQAFRETPGAKMLKPVLGKLGNILAGNKKREEGKPNATATDRQRARRDTPGSPLRDILGKIGTYTKEGLKEAGSTIGDTAGIAGLAAGPAIRHTQYYKDRQIREAADRVQKRTSKAQKVTDDVNRVLGENG